MCLQQKPYSLQSQKYLLLAFTEKFADLVNEVI